MWPPRASTPRRQETLGARPPPARCGTDRLHTAPATSDRGPMGKLSPGSQSRVLPQPRPGWRLQGRSEPRHPAATRVCSPRRTPGTLTWEEAAPTPTRLALPALAQWGGDAAARSLRQKERWRRSHVAAPPEGAETEDAGLLPRSPFFPRALRLPPRTQNDTRHLAPTIRVLLRACKMGTKKKNLE